MISDVSFDAQTEVSFDLFAVNNRQFDNSMVMPQQDMVPDEDDGFELVPSADRLESLANKRRATKVDIYKNAVINNSNNFSNDDLRRNSSAMGPAQMLQSQHQNMQSRKQSFALAQQQDRGQSMVSITSNAVNVQPSEDFFLYANRLAPWKGSSSGTFVKYSVVKPAPNIDAKNQMMMHYRDVPPPAQKNQSARQSMQYGHVM
jgi:hypothetical protein